LVSRDDVPERTRGMPATTLPVLKRIKAHGSPQAEALAAWLGAHLHGA
jgi:hypothetical protein